MTTALPRLTALYVPGSRPDRFAKAVWTGAQVVILDLEDSVAPDDKVAARTAVEKWVLAPHSADSTVVQVRVNSLSSAWALDDLAMVARLAKAGPVELRLSKTETVEQVDAAFGIVGPGVPVIALIETALALENCREIASHPAVAGLALGDSDLAGDLGSSSDAVLDWARIRLLVASRASMLAAPMMSVFPNIADLNGLESDTRRGRDLGLVGRTAVHPSQLPAIVRAFTPETERLAWAREVQAALTASEGGVCRLASGEMVDAAMGDQARSLLALAEAAATFPT